MSNPGEPLKFISEEIEVSYKEPPALSKRPGPPDSFIWRGREYKVAETIGEWFDFGRKGDMAHNMAPEHLQAAAARGSRGVGKFYFRVRTSDGRIFDLYYDRAPKEAGDRAGTWILWREMAK